MRRDYSVGSGLTISETYRHAELWCCRRWLVASDDFERVTILDRRGNRLHVDLAGVDGNTTRASVYASQLWRPDQLEHARERRARDLAIDRLDQEEPVDATTLLALEVVYEIFGGDIVVDFAGVRGLLRRAGRAEGLENLHELAYPVGPSDHADVVAPIHAFVDLAQAVAAASAQSIDERGHEIAEARTWHRAVDRANALAMVRRWAGLPPLAVTSADEPVGGDGGEIVRLRALVELAAGELDAVGRPDVALQLRKAAFPHRFKA